MNFDPSTFFLVPFRKMQINIGLLGTPKMMKETFGCLDASKKQF